MFYDAHIVLCGIRKFDLYKHGSLFQNEEFNALFMGARTESERDRALELIENNLGKLGEAYHTLWDVYNAEKAKDCSDKLLDALAKRVVPIESAGYWKAPQYGVELVEYSKLVKQFTLLDEVDSEVWGLLIEGFKTLKANLETVGFRFTFERRLSALEAELAESE
jgi:hypothetical protein